MLRLAAELEGGVGWTAGVLGESLPQPAARQARNDQAIERIPGLILAGSRRGHPGVKRGG
jgi:hypothetical protein